MIEKFIQLALLLVVFGCGSAKQVPVHKEPLWQSWNVVTELQAQEPKPILIDIYTNWCVYCKKMDATTYRNDSVVAYMRQHYYRYKLNGEGKDTIRWAKQQFTFNPRYDTHDFVVYLTRGKTVYPTTVIITPGGQPFYQHGELKPGDLELLLKYFASPRRKEQTLEAFAADFKPTWK